MEHYEVLVSATQNHPQGGRYQSLLSISRDQSERPDKQPLKEMAQSHLEAAKKRFFVEN